METSEVIKIERAVKIHWCLIIFLYWKKGFSTSKVIALTDCAKKQWSVGSMQTTLLPVEVCGQKNDKDHDKS